MVHVLNQISPFLPFMLTDAFLNVFIQSWQFRRGAISFAEVVSSGHHIQCRPEEMWCDAALSRIVRRIFSSLWRDPGMSLNCGPTRVCCKSASRPGYVVKVRLDPGMSLNNALG